MLALPQNLGFGGGSNAGFRAARNDIVVLLNSDMRVAPIFWRRCWKASAIPRSSPSPARSSSATRPSFARRPGSRKAGGRTAACASATASTTQSTTSSPASTAAAEAAPSTARSSSSSADSTICWRPSTWKTPTSAIMAWKRGWKVLYQPRSVVFHEHRGTIGKKFTEDQIQAVLRKNYVLFCWKNIHEWPRLASHFFFAWAGAVLAVLFGDLPLRPNLAALWRAFRQLPQALRSRRRALALAAISDTEAFRRPLGGYFRDRFAAMEPAPDRPARAVRFALPHLPARPRRRRLHVPDAARDGEARRSSRGGVAGLALAGRGQPGAAHFLRLRRVAGAAQRPPQRHGLAGAARRSRVRQRRSGVAHPPPALLPADRSAATRVHPHGAVPRRVSPHRHGAVRARRATSNRSGAASAT